MDAAKLEYHRDYNNSRYLRWREYAIARLGGRCVVCGVIENLEFDHIDPATKSFTLAIGWARAKNVVDAELDKCQLLCALHHKEKSMANGEYGPKDRTSTFVCCGKTFVGTRAFAGHRRWCKR